MSRNKTDLKATDIFKAAVTLRPAVVLRLLAAGLIIVWLMASCASIGRIEGGPRDVTPPVYVRSNPPQGATNVSRSRFEITFNENVQLDDAFNKVIVSPTQKTPPSVRAQGGRQITVELRDTLQPDATYTIDFGDAIKDLNEGNILDGFALDFSTGNTLDSLRISGVLLEAQTLEPAQGMLVGVISNLTDTALTSLPLERVARTNSRGQFTIRGLKEGQYRVAAINDVNRDNKWDRSEGVAFYDIPVGPSVESIVVSDTLRNAEGQDSIVTRPGVAFHPADVLLTWFTEDFSPHYMKDNSRPARNQVKVILSAPYDSVPRASIVRTPSLEGVDWNDVSIADFSAGNDTLTWWITDRRVINTDSLSLALTYPKTDSLENIVMTTDTLRFYYRPSSAELKAAKEKAKLKEKGADTIPDPQIFMELQPLTSKSHEIYNPLIIASKTPWAEIDYSKIKFTTTADSVWETVRIDSLQAVPGQSILLKQLKFDVKPGNRYVFEADSAAIFDIYGNPAKAFKHDFNVKLPEDYSTLVFNVAPADSSIIVELLDSSDKVVRTAHADAKGKAVFKYVTPGTYYARLYFDDNGDGKWSPGVVAEMRQPEETAYYPKKIDARANWDIDLSWNIYDIPLDTQKPFALLKNKPKLKNGEVYPKDEEQEYDEWGNPIDRNSANRYGTGNFNSNTNQQTLKTATGLLRR